MYATYRVLVLSAVLITSVFVAPAANASVTYNIRGSVYCNSGAVVGVYMHSSGGGSDFASWTAFPGHSNIARYSRQFTTALPSKIWLSVGCGGTKQSWGSSNNTPQKSVSSATTVYMNTTCNVSTKTCSFPAAPTNNGSTTTNPITDTHQCTYRASAYWKVMTGRYPAWFVNGHLGDAGYWDDNAKTYHWSVWSFAAAGSLFVQQPWTDSSGRKHVGHVGFVADTRVYNGVLQTKIYDRNNDGIVSNIDDRNAVWITPKAGTTYIVPPAWTGSAY
jgi:hypothetical protein